MTSVLSTPRGRPETSQHCRERGQTPLLAFGFVGCDVLDRFHSSRSVLPDDARSSNVGFWPDAARSRDGVVGRKKVRPRSAQPTQARRPPRFRGSERYSRSSCDQEAVAQREGCASADRSASPSFCACCAFRSAFLSSPISATQRCTIRAYWRVDMCGDARSRLGERKL